MSRVPHKEVDTADPAGAHDAPVLPTSTSIDTDKTSAKKIATNSMVTPSISSSSKKPSKPMKDERLHSMNNKPLKAPTSMSTSTAMGTNTTSTSSSTPRIQQPPFPHSSDSLLHHLHTDPQSSHITVCGAASPVAHRHAVLAKEDAGLGGATELENSQAEVVHGVAEFPVGSEGEGSGEFRHRDTPRRASALGRRSSASSAGSSSGPLGKPVDVFQPPGTPSHSSKKRIVSRETDSAGSTGDQEGQIEQEETYRRDGTSTSASKHNLGGPSAAAPATTTTPIMPPSPLRQRSSNLRSGIPVNTRKESSSGRTRPSTAPSAAMGRRKSGIPAINPNEGGKNGQESGPITPSAEGQGYFDLNRSGKDRRGKQTTPSAINRTGGNATSVRSRTSTASSLHLGPLPGPPSAGISQFGDGLVTPSTDGHLSVGTGGRDGDDEFTADEDDEAQGKWPVQDEVAAEYARQFEHHVKKAAIATSTLMSPARPASNAESHFSGTDEGEGYVPKILSDSTGIVMEALVPDSADTPDQVETLNERLRRLEQNGGGLPDSGDDVATPTNNSSTAPNSAGTGCLDQFVQQFQGVVREQLDKEQRNGASESNGRANNNPTGSTKLVGSAGSLSPDDRGMYLNQSAREMLGPAELSRKQASPNWAMFMQAYSAGRWDPDQTPAPPMSAIHNLAPLSSSTKSSPGASFSVPKSSDFPSRKESPGYELDKHDGAFGLANILTKNSSNHRMDLSGLAAGLTTASFSGSSSAPSTTTGTSPPRMNRYASATTLPRRWNSEKREFSSPGDRPISDSPKRELSRAGPGPISLASGAATTMLASQLYSSSSFHPLGAPSPERELLDPMASAMNLESDRAKARKNSSSSDSSMYLRPHSRTQLNATGIDRESKGDGGGNRRDVVGTVLSTIAASPATTPNENHPDSRAEPSPYTGSGPPISQTRSSRYNGLASKNIPPASAPIDWQRNDGMSTVNDYFGSAVLQQYEATPPTSTEGTDTICPPSLNSRSSSTQTITRYSNSGSKPISSSALADSDDEGDQRYSVTPSGPAKPRLTSHASYDQSSSRQVPPATAMLEGRADVQAGLRSRRASRALSFEEHYLEKGYLRAPIPPNDLQRRKALYRFKLLHTAQDANFDRIAQLAKLVFSTRIVLISLVDEDYNWHKVDLGLGASRAERGDSFCSHVVLSKSAEPMVVLDTLQDWRFKHHPFVTGPPDIRFYAGAPLRTAEGYNVGSICIIDNQPRAEFPPRSRMALKEFAGIVVREMELWRDKTRLKARDRIQTSMERFTRECLEMDNAAESDPKSSTTTMEKVYEQAAKLVCRTLDLDGAVVLDLSQFESVELTNAEGEANMVYQADPYDMGSMTSEDEHHVPSDAYGDRASAFGPLPPWNIMGAAENKFQDIPGRSRPAASTEHARFSDFLTKHPEGRIYEQVVPSWIRHILPEGIQYAMVVPIFNIDKHPFALLCAYTCNKSKQFLEGYELQFLRAIGVVILSAVLKRRMILADKAKSNFISNISHELRTPLHGILAAAELLSDTKLDSNQESFLSTVQACGNSLIETVNHVLDFTKLSGSAKGTIENVIKPGLVDLAHLVEETVEGCWIGQRARAQQGQSEIGSFYSPPSPGAASGNQQPVEKVHVETVVDVGFRERGWLVRCEKGGIRRVLMNLIGNSLKFTRDGYIQVTLRELPHTPGGRTIPVEMAVIDTGKGISRSFLKDQLFHPFSQENPLQTGTGLGLAIVNSIVRSESVNGKVDVWSAEGLGTEIKITLNVELEGDITVDDAVSSNGSSSGASYWNEGNAFGRHFSVSMTNFQSEHRGSKLNQELIIQYLRWWAFQPIPEDSGERGDIIITDEEGPLLRQLLDQNDVSRGVLILSTNRSARPSATMSAYQKAGGFVQMVFKPVGPQRLQAALRACAQALTNGPTSLESSRSTRSDYFSPPLSPSQASNSADRPTNLQRGYSTASSLASSVDRFGRPEISRESTATIGSPMYELPGPQGRLFDRLRHDSAPGTLLRRRSEEDGPLQTRRLVRPGMSPRSTTYQDTRPSLHAMVSHVIGSDSGTDEHQSAPGSPSSAMSTVSVTDGAVMLKKATVPPEVALRKPRILLVDDNHINLELLSAYLRKKKIEYQRCVNGQISVDAFSEAVPGYWDIILMDLSMPVMDGIEATRTIRKVESDRRLEDSIKTGEKPVGEKVIQQRCKIFALSGRATADDKKQAFAAGVDGYLVKPVKLSTLDAIIKRLGF